MEEVQQQQVVAQQPTIELVELVDNKTDENGQNFQVYQTQNGNQIVSSGTKSRSVSV